jgi:hypothetical protein
MKNMTANAATASVIATAATIRKSSSIGGLPAAMSVRRNPELNMAAQPCEPKTRHSCHYQEARAKSGDRREVKRDRKARHSFSINP